MSGEDDPSYIALGDGDMPTRMASGRRSGHKEPTLVHKRVLSEAAEPGGRTTVATSLFSPWSLPTVQGFTIHSPAALLSSDLLSTPSCITPLFDNLHADPLAAAPACDSNEGVRTENAGASTAKCDPIAYSRCTTPFILHNEGQQEDPYSLEEKGSNATRWRRLALQQQHSLVVLRDLNATLLEENAWLRKHVLCLQSDVKKNSEQNSQSSGSRTLPRHTDEPQSRAHPNVRDNSNVFSAKTRFVCASQNNYETGNPQVERIGILRDIPSGTASCACSASENDCQTNRYSCQPLCTDSACRRFYCSHPFCGRSRQSLATRAHQPVNICGCCRCIGEATVPRERPEISPASNVGTELSVNCAPCHACRPLRVESDRSDLPNKSKPDCTVTERKIEHVDCKKEGTPKRTFDNSSHTTDLRAGHLRDNPCVPKETVECQSCLRLLSVAHEWSRCAAVLEGNRLKDLEEIASLEMRINGMRNDVTLSTAAQSLGCPGVAKESIVPSHSASFCDIQP